ncbi:hypothetical protein HanRHA438_Chr06g0278571 [Helianthus annuus]|nr:hypothetical protein HanRHA438_Chr06g0278571 [Helianthus annuus]
MSKRVELVIVAKEATLGWFKDCKGITEQGSAEHDKHQMMQLGFNQLQHGLKCCLNRRFSASTSTIAYATYKSQFDNLA